MSTQPAAKSRPPFSVVVVDDADDIRLLLRVFLGRDDRFTLVAEAENGVEAIEAARLHQPDLMVLDLMMPVLDGISAIPGIRLASPGIRILAYSGMTDEGATRALAAGADQFLEKGVSPVRLADELYRLGDS